MTPVPVTAIILTQDEEINIPRCSSAQSVRAVESGFHDRFITAYCRCGTTEA